MRAQVIKETREFIAANFLFRDDRAELTDTDSLLDAGLIDSTGVLELVAFLEKHFEITIADADIVPDNLDTVEAIANFVERQRAGATDRLVLAAAS